MARVFVAHAGHARSLVWYRLHLRDGLLSMERFLVRGVTLSMAGNARKGPHCIGIVFLCQKWRLWGLFFAGWSFAMKSMLPLIRQNVFLTAGHSPFLELLTLQKGPIAPFSVTTALFGRNGRFGGARRRCACSSPAVCLTLRYVLLVACRSLPISRFCQSLSAVCRLAPGACHSVWPLPSAPGLSPCRSPLPPGTCSFPSA